MPVQEQHQVPTQEQRLPSITVHEAWLPEEHPLHRPRHGGRQRVALSAALIFFLTPILALGIGVQPAKFENRELADAPSISDGWGFFANLSTWASDHLPFRDAAVRSSDQISRGVFDEPAPLAGPPGSEPGFGPGVGPVAPSPGGELLPSAGFPNVIEGDEGWLYFGYDVEGKCTPIRPLDQVIHGLLRLRAAVEQSGRRFIVVIPPDKSTAVPEYLPDSFAGQHCARMHSEQFWRRVTTEAGAIDLRPVIRDVAKVGVPVYNRLDTHWTDAGSLTMVRTVAEEIQPGVSRSWVVEPVQLRESEADLPRLIGRTGTDQIQIYRLAPNGQQDRTKPYVDNMAAPAYFVSEPVNGMVTTQVAMITDSFALPASRYLAATFSDLTAVYAMEGHGLDTVTEVMADSDVVVLEVVERTLASGKLSLLDDAAIDRIAKVLSARPVN